MSADSLWDVQTAVFARLSSSSSLVSFLADGAEGVKDHVPPSTAFPYVVIGETRARPFDMAIGEGYESFFAIHTYSRSAGMNETKQIMAAVYDLLHNEEFMVPNQHLVLCQLQQSETRLETDGKTRHGIQQFRIITEPI